MVLHQTWRKPHAHVLPEVPTLSSARERDASPYQSFRSSSPRFFFAKGQAWWSGTRRVQAAGTAAKYSYLSNPARADEAPKYRLTSHDASSNRTADSSHRVGQGSSLSSPPVVRKGLYRSGVPLGRAAGGTARLFPCVPYDLVCAYLLRLRPGTDRQSSQRGLSSLWQQKTERARMRFFGSRRSDRDEPRTHGPVWAAAPLV